MKLAFCLFKYFPFGGLQRDFFRIAKECIRRGHEVHVYCMDWTGEVDPDLHVTILPVRAWQNHTQAQQFVALLKSKLQANRYDLVVGFNKIPGLDVYYAADSCFGAKEKHGRWYCLTPRYRHSKRYETSVFSQNASTEILLLAKRQQEEFTACYQTPLHRLHLLPPGISCDRIAPANAKEIRSQIRMSLNLQDHHFLLLMVGSGFKTKGLDRALACLAKLPLPLKQKTFFYIIGQDNPTIFKTLSKKLGIAERVVFLGGRHDVAEFLLAADLLMHPAYFENTGTVLLEAMVSGLPVLTNDICGYSEYVREYNAGIVVPSPFQQPALNKALETMLTVFDRENWRKQAAHFAATANIYSLVPKAVDLFERFAAQKIHLSFEQMMKLEGKRFREVEGRSTKQVMLNGYSYFIKQHHGVGWKEIFKNLLQGRLPVISAKNEWQAIHKLAQVGVRTPDIVGYGCRGVNPARMRSWILMRELQNVTSLEDLGKSTISSLLKRYLIKQVAGIAKTMHANGINHRDFYLCHFLFNPEERFVYLIDLHRAQIRKKVPLRWLLKDLSGLYFSSKDVKLTSRDLLRFIKYYRDKPLRQIFKQEKTFWQRVKNEGNILYDKIHKINKAKHLRKINFEHTVPFQLVMENSKPVLVCESIVRLVPGKRLVAYATWNNHAVVAKIFFEKHRAKSHRFREEKGVRALLESGIETPKILFTGCSDDQKIQVVLFERIFNAESFQTILENRPPDFLEHMQKLTLELATQHVLGLLQHDLHFKNFLLAHNKIYTLDAADIEKKFQPIGKKESIENLALFFSQLGTGTEELKDMLYRQYAKARGWTIKKSDLSFLEASIKKCTHDRWLEFQKKIQRTCSAFVRQETFSQTIMFDREYASENLLEILKNPEKVFNDPSVKILKAGNSSTVIEIKLDNRMLVIKRYNTKSWMHGLRRWLRQTRAERSWQYAHLLRLFSIPTAKPVAYVENHYFGWNTNSYFFMEKIPGKDVGAFFVNYNEQNPIYSEMADKIVLLFQALKALSVTHGDLKQTNILIHHNTPWLIDLDGMCRHRVHRSFKQSFSMEMARFIKNWECSPNTKILFSGKLDL